MQIKVRIINWRLLSCKYVGLLHKTFPFNGKNYSNILITSNNNYKKAVNHQYLLPRQQEIYDSRQQIINQCFNSTSALRKLSWSVLDNFCQTSVIQKRNEFENPYEELLEKKKAQYLRSLIVLIDTDESIKTLPLNKAQRLSVRRNLKLVQLKDPNKINENDKPIYQLITITQYREEMLLRKEKKMSEDIGFKGKKTFTVSQNIDLRDLKIKLKKWTVLLQKNYQIVFIVTGLGGSKDKIENILGHVEEALKECQSKIVQKSTNDDFAKFTINPQKKPKNNSDVKPPVLDE